MKKNLLIVMFLVATIQTWSQQITESTGWLESAFVKWQPVSNAQSYNVYYTGEGITDRKIDNQLIRSYGSYFRADIPGLKAGSYTVKIKPVISGVEGNGTTTSSLTVKAQDRTGFAFSNGRIPGGYNADGTVKSNAVILYITQQTKNTVSLNVTGATTNPCVGLQTILDGYKKGQDLRPLIVRIVGQITDLSYMQSGDIAIENNKNASSYITLEGIGNDAVADGWGIRIKNASNIEIRNIGTMNCNSSEGDNIGLQQNNDYVWVHNCDLFYGDAGSDADQVKGDGAMDCKKSTYVTFSYNHFWDSGKSNLLGLSEGTTAGLYITYHHNWYDHSDSRHPRVRYYSAHVYNNYYDGNSKYGVGSTLGSSVFVENNFFRNCKYPMLTSMQGTDVYNGAEGTFSGENGGTIKAFNNTISGQTRFVGYDASTNPVEFDAYIASTRNETISSNIKSKQGANSYNNFDTNSSVMYSYTPDSPETAKTNVMQYAGRVSGGDLKWTFNNAVDDTADAVNTGLKAALVGYQTTLVFVQDGTNTPPTSSQTLTSTANNNQTVTSGTAISSIVFTWGGDATDATVTGLPASGISFVKNTTAKTITITGTPTATVSYSIATTGTGTPATGSGTITVTTSAAQTLTSTSNNSQTVASGTAISTIVFTWGGSATDATVTGLPTSGISFVKNSTAKTITITGTPTATLSYSIATTGTSGSAANGSGTITVTTGTPSGNQIHNFTTSGKTSTFYNITGNMNSTPGSVTYAGLTLTERLKIESSTTITYTTTSASTLTLVFDSNFTGTIKVNNVSYTASAGIVTASIPAGTNTITKGSVANLFYISTAYTGSTLRVAQTSTEEVETTKTVLYPNPVTDVLYLSHSNQQVEKIEIYNISGTLVTSSGKNVENIDISKLVHGAYLAKIYTKNGIINQTILKK